jgi:Glycosyl transferase family 1
LSSIAYYITGHGYGHAVRSNGVIQALTQAAPSLKIHVRTTAPQWLFHSPTAPVFYFRGAFDVGMQQKDSLEMDLGGTLLGCRALHAEIPRLIEGELRFIEEHDIRLILGDIPPVAFEIASRASLPSAGITNFTWDWIYRTYLQAQPAFLPLIEEMESFYRKATLALTLPYACSLEVFSRRESIPWIARASMLTKEQAKAKYDLPTSQTIILLSFGGLGLERLPREKLRRLRDYCFVTTGESKRRDGNWLTLPGIQHQYQDLVRAADMIITKPGYGIVADVIAHQTPILYTDRGEFPEYPHLVQALNDLAISEFIPQEDLFSGNIGAHVARLLEKPARWPAVALNGSDVAAKKILALMDDRSR